MHIRPAVDGVEPVPPSIGDARVPADAIAASAPTSYPEIELRFVEERLIWLGRLRWIAVGGVLGVVALVKILGVAFSEIPILAITGTLVAANLGFGALARCRRTSAANLEGEALAQISVDVLALAALLHWTDGIENPFAFLFVILVAIGAKILRPRAAYAVAALATALQGGVIAAEHAGLLAHHPFRMPGDPEIIGHRIEQAPYLLAYFASFAFTMFGTVWLMQSLARREHSAAEERRKLEALAASRARLAHLGEWSAGLAHTLRNPVHGLQNCVDILRDDLPPEVVDAETFAMMDDALRRIATVSSTLLHYARPAPLDPQPVDLQDVAEAGVRRALSAAPGAALCLCHIPGPPVLATVDPDALGDVLDILIENAIAACADGGKVEVYALPPTRGAGLARLRVKDTGEGIAPEHLPRVFDAFFTTRAPGEGTGLGLAVARRIIEEHGGTIEIHSALGAGTVVELGLAVGPLAPLVQRVGA